MPHTELSTFPKQVRLDRLGVSVGLEQPQHAVDMRQVGAVLFELAFELFD
jgi:hypothetical protein